MTQEWYYSDGGDAVGPVSGEEVARWIARSPQPPHLVWKAGMSEWADASTLPNFQAVPASAAPSPQAGESASSQDAAAGAGNDSDAGGDAKTQPHGKHAALVERARDEIIEFLAISAYLYVCLGALVFYKASFLRSAGIEYESYGIALVKALILGKFMLILHALKIGEGSKEGSTLLAGIAKKALLFALLLVVMDFVEEIIVGYFHGRTSRETLRGSAGRHGHDRYRFRARADADPDPVFRLS